MLHKMFLFPSLGGYINTSTVNFQSELPFCRFCQVFLSMYLGRREVWNNASLSNHLIPELA